MQPPFISILIPVYNAEDYLQDCLTSVVEQSLTNIEVIIINDGSTDKSLKVAQKFATNDPRIQIFTKSNGGVSSARNLGLRKCSGDFILQVDADDILLEDALLNLHQEALKENFDLVIGDYKIRSSGTKKHIKNGSITDAAQLLQLTLEGKIHSALWNKLIRKEFFEGLKFIDGRDYMEDKLMLAKILLRNPKISSIDKDVYEYIQREESYSNNISKSTISAYEFTIRELEKLMSHRLEFKSLIKDLKINFKIFVLLNAQPSRDYIRTVFSEVNREVLSSKIGFVHKSLLWMQIRNFSTPSRVYRWQRSLINGWI